MPRPRSAHTELALFGSKRRHVPKAPRSYSPKYRPSSLFHVVIRRVSTAQERASNNRRSFSISSSLTRGWDSRMDCRSQRSAVSDSSAHWRNPAWVVRGNRTAFISAFTRWSRRSQRGTLLERFIVPTSTGLNFNALHQILNPEFPLNMLAILQSRWGYWGGLLGLQTRFETYRPRALDNGKIPGYPDSHIGSYLIKSGGGTGPQKPQQPVPSLRWGNGAKSHPLRPA